MVKRLKEVDLCPKSPTVDEVKKTLVFDTDSDGHGLGSFAKFAVSFNFSWIWSCSTLRLVICRIRICTEFSVSMCVSDLAR